MLHGIDISSYQSSGYPTSGLSFVFIKVTEGMSYVNPKWKAQRTTARDAHLVTGFYHYPHIANSPTAEADHFLAQLDLAAGEVVCLDWEWYGQKVSDAKARSYKDAWIAHVRSEAPGHRVVVYCDRSNWVTVDTDSNCGDGLWIADYTTPGKPRIKHHWTFHQYADSPQDKNVANFASVDALRAWAHAPHTASAPGAPSDGADAPTGATAPAGSNPPTEVNTVPPTGPAAPAPGTAPRTSSEAVPGQQSAGAHDAAAGAVSGAPSQATGGAGPKCPPASGTTPDESPNPGS
ncbi:glycoside hydrolase family 25 protein [Streptomyces sp. ICBB 8177]|uniref:glycoside hydrolase family 25 protein n=1 Tax=Streptomyces sp. ICBB 8177 TaxID=563922 RepID=UPI000D67CCF7|nr:muramidase [Streptomyces sp. ICBB 8177]